MRFAVTPILLAGTLILASAATPLHAQVDSREGIALQNEIYQLRQEVRSLESQIARGGGGGNSQPGYNQPPPPQYGSQSSDIVTQLLTRVDALEEQVRQLRGRVDENQNQLQRQAQDLNKRIDDLSFQISQGTQTPPPAAPATPAHEAARPEKPAPAPVNRTPEMILQEGHAAIARRDYTAAEADARQVLANRTSPRAYDAQLLLAQSLTGERQYAQAAIAYDDAYNRSRKGSHAQDALLGLARSLSEINEKKAACDTISRLKSEFPQPRPDIREGMTATAQRAGCR
jgi:TolA-binding protein